MEILKIFDSGNYEKSLPRAVRRAVRGIIEKDGRLLMIKSEKYGDCKFPGGGALAGENREETLIREVREETGFDVIPESIVPFGETVEIRKDLVKNRIFEQRSYYYLCSVGGTAGETCLDDYEKEYGYHALYITPAEAITQNEGVMKRGGPAWTERENCVLTLLAKGRLSV